MNIWNSECSSGCESGWTMYLDQFSSSIDKCNRSKPLAIDCQSKGVYVNEDEDLSMLSDASSGPPHFHKDEDCSEETRYTCTVSATEEKRSKHRNKVKEHRKKQQNFHLEDTASSPDLSFSENNAVLDKDKSLMEHDSGFSQGFSATHFKGKSVTRKHFGFLKSMTRKAD